MMAEQREPTRCIGRHRRGLTAGVVAARLPRRRRRFDCAGRRCPVDKQPPLRSKPTRYSGPTSTRSPIPTSMRSRARKPSRSWSSPARSTLSLTTSGWNPTNSWTNFATIRRCSSPTTGELGYVDALPLDAADPAASELTALPPGVDVLGAEFDAVVVTGDLPRLRRAHHERPVLGRRSSPLPSISMVRRARSRRPNRQ